MNHELTKAEKDVLCLVQCNHGKQAKRLIRQAWETGSYSHFSYMSPEQVATLQTIRNSRGPSWLAKTSLKAIASTLHLQRLNNA